MNIEIITTGEEVLSGQIVDSNAAWLATYFEEQGFSVRRRTTVGDRLEDLIAIFRERAREADIVIVNGGLGPTVDDLSSEAAARAIGQPREVRQDWVETMQKMFAATGREMPERNIEQARLPRGAELLFNPIGTACGFAITLEGARLYFTPGPPRELKRMMREQIMPRLREHFELEIATRLKKITAFGISESRLDQVMGEIPLAPEIRLGFRSQFPIIEIKIMGAAPVAAAERLDADMERAADAVRRFLGDFRVFEEEQGLAERIQELMIAGGHTLALAESCTGGMIADLLVAVPGSSAYFDRGFVTYSYEAKSQDLGVSSELIQTHGAVSLEVAREMARGAQRRGGVSHAIGVSGIAGPGGATDDKPVGVVAFSLASPDGVFSRMLRLPKWDRWRIRKASAIVALDMLRRSLEGFDPFGAYDYTRMIEEERLDACA
jgi:nicotinamide-nucleotide amidase